MDRRLCRPGELRLAQIITVCALVCLAEHQVASAGPTPDPIKRTPTRFELKFQSELDNSTVIKHPLQQQVFKCQVRLAPLSQAAPPSNQARRLRTFSSWLTKEGVDQKFRKVVQDVQDEQLARMLSLSPLEAGKQLPHKQLVNVTHFSIDWLKDGQSIWNAFEGNPIAIVNVTLKTPRIPSKSGARPRIEVKNTLNGQQMKLTSRLRLGQLRQSDSGQYKCLARVSFLMRPLEPLSDGLEHGLTEYIEQSLESSGAHLLVAPLMISNSTIGNEGVASNLERPASSPQSNSSEADQPSKDGSIGTINYQSSAGNASRRTICMQLARPISTDCLSPASRPANGPDETNHDSQHNPPTGSYDRDVTRRKAAAQSDDTQDAEDALAPAQLSDGVGGRSTAGTHSNPLFEDDEDLFRLDLGELISGQQPQQAGADNISSRRDWQMAAKGSGANSSDTMDSNANDLLVNSQSEERQHEAYLDWILDNGDSSGSRWAEVEGGTGAGSRSSARGRAELESLSPSSGAQQQSASGAGDKKIDDRAETSLPGASVSNSSGASEAAGGDHQRAWEDKPRGLAEASPGSRQRAAPFDHRHASSSSYADQLDSFSDSAASRSAHRSKLARFVHRIVPEPSCYTGLGEHYRGNVSISSDQRACLNWLQVRAALSQPAKTRLSSNQNRSFSPAASGQRAASALAQARDEDHNHCRNPNGDHRGPWCFVAYSEELDGPLVMQPYLSASGRQWKSATSRQRSVRVGPESGRLFVVAHCQLASCSEYLWLYVVAPPLGLLVVFICLISLTIRSIRKSHYNAIFSAAYQRHSDSSAKSSSGLLCRFAQTRKRESHVLPQKASRACGLFSSLTRKLAPSSPKKGKLAQRDKYFNEDLFEVVDDIDWSDNGPTSQSMSPSESFRLHSTATTCEEGCSFKSPISAANRQANNWQQRSTLTHSMSTNPMLPKHNQMAALDLPMNEAQRNKPTTSSGSNGGHAGRMSKSKSQAGPLFATLRCHVRHAQHQQKMQQRRPQDVNGADSQSLAKKSSSFIENCQASLIKQSATSSKLQEAATSNDNSLASTTKTDLLLSCGSSTSDEGNGSAPSSNDKSYTVERCPLAKELARLDASSVTLAYDTQPIYEGKFSQVQTAYIKQRNDDLAQATGRIGAQVAVCSLKEHAAIDESIFYAENLRVHHFNHLNILKLLGYVQPETGSDAYEGSSIVKSSKCLLIYDMAHLIDLNDWLKEQSKDAFEAQNDCELSLRQNLSCIAKQIALAIDYLHDKNIIYKDLACRNCFLDVTRMLVKLASFNIEPVIDARDGTSSGFDNSDYYRDSGDNGSISKKLSIKSMVRPKYLLDYYVIDSRPAECQLLPLSWISLESILFNKFNKQTDIWSFGCLLYELFSLGEVAYFGYSSKQVIDSVRSNLMPPQPLLCPNGIYKLMCKCLSDIPTLRPNIKHVYEQLNLYSGQCSSFLNHHLCII